jgi:hypothetical protein
VLVSLAVAGGSAWAGPALDDDKQKERAPSPVPEPPLSEEAPVEYGVGVRLRSVWVPKAVLELFVERSAGGAHNYGFGVDLTRRRGTTELQVGLEYERVNVGQGVWINKGDNVAPPTNDEADFVLGPDASDHQLAWFTVEFTFLNHAEINKYLSVRYGGGIGLGIIIGELDHYNIRCTDATNSAPEPGCVPPRFGGTGTYAEDNVETLVAYDLPPVFPVVNAIIGLQVKPTPQMTINIEGGIRTLPFIGVSSSFFF